MGLNQIKPIFIAICLICSSFVHATDCADNVRPIKEGEPAQCDGFLFSPETESKAYKATQLNDLYQKENDILEKRLDMYMKQSDVLAKEVSQRDNTENLYRILYFGLGAVVTGFIAANVNR